MSLATLLALMMTSQAAAAPTSPLRGLSETNAHALLSVMIYDVRSCDVHLDGKRVGQTPLWRAQVPTGEHDLVIRCGKKDAVARRVTLSPLQDLRVQIRSFDLASTPRRSVLASSQR